MPTSRFEWEALAQLLVGGCAVSFCACVLIEHAQAQPGYVPPSPPPPPPVFNPSSPYTVPQPSYTPLAPSTPSTTPFIPSTIPRDEVTSPSIPRREAASPVNEESPRTTTRSHHRRRASVYGTRSVFGPIVIGPPPIVYSYVGYGAIRAPGSGRGTDIGFERRHVPGPGEARRIAANIAELPGLLSICLANRRNRSTPHASDRLVFYC